MNEELYSAFLSRLKPVLLDKKFPTEDVCRVFNILVQISPYFSQDTASDNMLLIHEILGRLKHSIYDIPKPHFARMLSNLIDF